MEYIKQEFKDRVLNDDVEQLHLDLDNLNNVTGLGDVSQITSSIGWVENTSELLYANGKFTGSGYYNESVTINGYAIPVLKSRMPNKISGVEFYIKAKTNEEQTLNVFVGYTPSITSASGMVKVKEATFTVPLTTSFQKYSFPLEVTKEDLSAVAEDGMFVVGYYPPNTEDSTKPIGCGNISPSDEGYVETATHKAFYYYTWE